MTGYAKPTVIGQVTIPEPFEHTRYYEYAAYFQTIDVQPGTYDIVATYSSDTWADQKPYYMTVKVPGTVTFTNPGERGGEATHDIQIYGYQANDAERIWHGTITWADGFEVLTVDYGAHVVPVTMLATLEQRALGADLNLDAAREVLRLAEAGEYRFGSYTDIKTHVGIATQRRRAAESNQEHMARILANHLDDIHASVGA